MRDDQESAALASNDLARLRELRLLLLRLHKELLELERLEYERVSGRVNAGELLQLAVSDPRFAWLRMISALVVEIDELADRKVPTSRSEFTELISQTRQLLSAPTDDAFKTKYQAALQREPAVVMAHSAIIQLLKQS